MSTGKRLAKRSIIGTRVCAPGEDGQFYSGVIHAVKTPGQIDAGHHADTRYSVRFDPCVTATHKAGSRVSREYKDCELIGPGFGTVLGCSLQQGQRVYLTYNGREICGAVTSHQTEIDEVCVTVSPPGSDGGAPMELKKRLEEVRLLESRKSLRLMDQDTDFARLADMAGDRKRASSNSIDVPAVQGSRKRRPSESGSGSGSGSGKDLMDECTAALVLMSLSCSPHSPQLNGYSWSEGHPPSPTSDAWSRGSTPSPPLSDGGNSTSSFWSQVATDEGIVCDQDFDDLPKKKKLHVDTGTRVVFQCTWPGCLVITTTCNAIEHHVRHTHLGPRKLSDDTELSDHEEEFYYTEVELGNHTSSPPTLSHRDMARPPHEDPEYLRQLRNGYGHTAGGIQRAGPINIPSSGHQMPWFSAAASSLGSPGKHLKLSPRSGPSPSLLSLSAPASHKLPGSPTRKHRGDTKKCRKVYGMEHRELWCTQCKWKKACTRFGE